MATFIQFFFIILTVKLPPDSDIALNLRSAGLGPVVQNLRRR